ncbi:MAG: cation transporter, partial [Ginsengibacter sp.]
MLELHTQSTIRKEFFTLHFFTKPGKLIASKENIRLQRVITLIALILFFIKIVAWFLTGSLAILTDALESIVNVVAGFIGIYSLTLSAKP